MVEVELPGKQGLKLAAINRRDLDSIVEVELPGKQGLKLSEVPKWPSKQFGLK